jgi:HSP20 family protein
MKISDKEKNRDLESTRGNHYLSPACDIKESDNDYVIYFDIPGVEKSDIDISVEKDVLTLTAECGKIAGDGYNRLHYEMDYSGYRRSFVLGNTIDPDKIEAVHENGTLVLTLPKREEKKRKEITIQVK